MLEHALRLIGIDLAAHVAELKARVDGFKTASIAEIKSHIVSLGISAALMVVGALFALMTTLIGLVALYRYIAIHYGPFAALGGLAATTGLLAIISITIGVSHGKSDTAKQIAFIRAQEAARQQALAAHAAATAAVTQIANPIHATAEQAFAGAATAETKARAENLFADQHFYKPLSTVVSVFFGAPRNTNSTLDKLAHEVTSKLAGKGDETVAVAAHVMRTGPKSAFYGVLAASTLLGFMLTRSNEKNKK